MMGGFGGGMGWAWIWPVILLLGLVALSWGLLRGRSASPGGGVGSDRDNRPQGVSHDQAREILRERYARGEISEEEMRERMRALDER